MSCRARGAPPSRSWQRLPLPYLSRAYGAKLRLFALTFVVFVTSNRRLLTVKDRSSMMPDMCLFPEVKSALRDTASTGGAIMANTAAGLKRKAAILYYLAFFAEMYPWVLPSIFRAELHHSSDATVGKKRRFTQV